jgi:hypothetical protein
MEDSEWAHRRFELTQQHHLERLEYFQGEDESRKSLERAHLEQLVRLETEAFSVRAQADLIRKQTRAIQDWRCETAATRQTLNARHRQEMAALTEKR